MVKTLIEWGAKPDSSWSPCSEGGLLVSEFFYDTIQGEGVYLGTPSAFLRLSGCGVGCRFCDTLAVWKSGVRLGLDDLISHVRNTSLEGKLSEGMHLVVTGGSPLLQQEPLAELLARLKELIPSLFIEIENECSIVPSDRMLALVDHWNNSPKLSNSEVEKSKRYFPLAIEAAGSRSRAAVFKFVVNSEADWKEIEEDYLSTGLVKKEQIILMPMGASRQEYGKAREEVVELAVNHGVRYSPREHISIWDKKTGI